MSTTRRLFRFGAAIAVGAGVIIGATATSASAVAQVPSDKITFQGVATPDPSGNLAFHSTKCSLVSDGEAKVPCQLNATTQGTTSGTASVTSSDGESNWDFTITQNPDGTFSTKSTRCVENDAPDPAQPAPPSNKCKAIGTLAVVSANPDGTFNVKGTTKIKEKSTAG